MATTTTITSSTMGSATYSREWNADWQKTSFHLGASTPDDAGAVRAGMGAWWVVRGVEGVIKRATGMEFGWVGQAGDIVYAIYRDGSGTAGGFASFTMLADGTWDYEFYADATSGSDGNGGTLSTDAFQTLVFALGEAIGALGGDPGSSVCLHLKRGETFATTGATTEYLIDLLGLLGHLCVDDYGAGAKPIVSFAVGTPTDPDDNGTKWSTGGLGDCALSAVNIVFNCGAPTRNFRFANHEGALAGSDGFNLTYIGCEINNFNGAIYGTSVTGLALRNGSTDHFTFFDSTITGCAQGSGIGEAAIIGFEYGRYLLMQDSAVNDSYDANGFVRLLALSYSCFDNLSFDRSTSGFALNVFRLPGGGGTTADDRLHSTTCHGFNFLACGEGIELDPVSAGESYFADVDIISCKYSSSVGGSLVSVQIVNANSADVRGLRILNCQHRTDTIYANPAMVTLISDASGAQRFQSVEIGHCSVYAASEGEFFSPVAVLLNQVGAAGMDAGCLTIHDNYVWGANASGLGASNPTAFISLGAADTVVASSNYNIVRKAANTMYFCSGAGGNRDLAAWQAATVHDDNSAQDLGAAHDFTDVTATSAFDLSPLAGTGPNAGAGDPAAVGATWLDYAGNLWDATAPDAGAVQFGGVAPDAPSAGGSSTPRYSSLSLGLRLGL